MEVTIRRFNERSNGPFSTAEPLTPWMTPW
jgi:hypothetical protein